MVRRTQPSKFPLAKLTEAQRADLDRLEQEAILHYQGGIDELEKALGLLRLGHHVGWKVLVVMHSKRTIAKYEEILGIKFSEYFGPTGPSSDRSMAFRIATKAKNFWKAVSGETPIPDRQRF